MKIVHIITRLIIGGAQENTLISCRMQASQGHKVYLITGGSEGPEGDMLEQARSMNIELVELPSLVRPIKPINDLTAYFQIKKALLRIKPDIVHTHSAKAGILGRLAGWSVKGSFAPSSGDFPVTGKDKPVPMVVHTIHGLAFHNYQSRWLNKFYIAVEKFAAKKCDALIGVADTMKEKAFAVGIGSEDMFTTAYSAIDVESFTDVPKPEKIKDFRRKYGISDQSKVIITVARLAELKGHNYIIESAKRLSAEFPECMWLFVGNGELTDYIKQQIQIAGLGYKIRLTGLLGPEQIPLAIHSADLLVHCSLREGLARVLPQAMLCGKPVVSFDIDGAKEVVNDYTGKLVAPEDIGALTDACRELLKDPDRRRCLGQNGKEQVEKVFSPEVMTNTIQRVYERY